MSVPTYRKQAEWAPTWPQGLPVKCECEKDEKNIVILTHLSIRYYFLGIHVFTVGSRSRQQIMITVLSSFLPSFVGHTEQVFCIA